MRRGPKDRYRFSHQGKLTWLILGAVAPAVIIVILILWFGDFSAKVQWTLAIVILTVAAGFISAARDHVVHPLQTMSNLLAALREGDYSIRARGALAACYDVDEDEPLALSFPGGSGRWGVRRSTFREHGLPHELLVLTDLSRTLREEERRAWQRLVRVLGHEMNNSLAPIKSLAGS